MNPARLRRGLLLRTLLLVFAAAFLAGVSIHAQTLRLDDSNPRYLNWRGRPTLVVGSGEHYGAVLNRDFDFATYLRTLRRDGLNHTRLFAGAAYVEPDGAFNIARNTLAPRGDHYLAPWARSSEPGYAGGGNRFDLERWDEAYFARLRGFVAAAAKNRVLVEVNLFCPFYEDTQWRLSPFHPTNNINHAGTGVARTNVYTLDRHGGLLAWQERFVRRVVLELESYDNLYYEICNEPYFGGVTLEWQAHMAQLIADSQKSHPHPKLISQNIANHSATVAQPTPHVSLYNFHYAAPPDAVAANRHLNLPIGDNETGFKGTRDAAYRIEAWDFLMAGGALFSHLDYSFTVGTEDGIFVYPDSQPGGGSPALRREFRILRSFLEGFHFTRMQPIQGAKVTQANIPLSVRGLVEPKRAAAVYLHLIAADPKAAQPTRTLHGAELQIPIDSGEWRATWIHPLDGREFGRQQVRTQGSVLTVQSPGFDTDIALKLVRARD